MKTPLSPTFRLLFASTLALLIAAAAQAQPNELDVGVRSTVKDRAFGAAGMKNPPQHSRIYGIVSVQQVKGESKLVKPVDEGMIMQVLSEQLNANGYRLFTPGTNPEILLTVYYGRGFLENPYQVEGGRTEVRGEASSAVGSGGQGISGPTVSITGDTHQLFNELRPGFQAKLAKAKYEKLYIRVSAWAFPSTAGGKTKQLWNTTMVVDDPEHRDLNAVAAKMLEAGAPFFDHEAGQEEVDVYKPLPDGRVNVGTPTVVDTGAPKSK